MKRTVCGPAIVVGVFSSQTSFALTVDLSLESVKCQRTINID